MTIHLEPLQPYLAGTALGLLLLLGLALVSIPVMECLASRRLVSAGVFVLMYAGMAFMLVGMSTGYVQFSLK